MITLRGIDAPLTMHSVKSSKVQRLIDQEIELLMVMMCMLTAVEEENEQSHAYDTLDPTLDHLINTITCLKSLPVYHLIKGMTMPLISNLRWNQLSKILTGIHVCKGWKLRS